MIPPNATMQRLDTTPVEPLSLDEGKAYLRVDTTVDDVLITETIKAARIKCEQIANANLTLASYRLTCDYLPWGDALGYLGCWQYGSSWGGFLELPYPPLTAVQSIRYAGFDGSSHLIDSTAYVVAPGSPGRIALAYGTAWPFVRSGVGAVQIEYTSGVPADKMAAVKSAIRLMLGHLYTHRSEDVPISKAIGYILDPVRNYGYG